MTSLLEVPILAVSMLTPERSVNIIRALLRSECNYAKVSPAVLTISSRLTVADGGIDAEVSVDSGSTIPSDCIFRPGLTGFQIKSGSSFKPWTESSVRSELLDSKGNLYPEVARLVQRGGCYSVICTGHDLTPQQRNHAKQQISIVLAAAGYPNYDDLIDIHGASQIAEFIERYPGIAALLVADPVQDAWVLEEWRHDAHMMNAFEASPEQAELISQIRAGMRGDHKHIRVLGEPGLGKTRIVLEALKEPDIAPCVLYIQHGSQFGQTQLFRRLLKERREKPLIVVIDELPESELSAIWRHLKGRCGSLKLISLDHGRDETRDEDICRLYAPRLPDETIKLILISRIGESRELDRWVDICDGSPRVAQAVADNLRANPDDLLRPPSTVPIWSRFLHGYDSRDDISARQIDCVAQHLALFSRFGCEAPVSDEARYISDLIVKIEPTIGWGRFQEIVKGLRARRVLQGSKTLFFVPKALHIHLWKQFWEDYGRGFDFTDTFKTMPESLHTWFMSMFKFAGESAAGYVIDDILKLEGIYADRGNLTSAQGSRFLSNLAEANPAAVTRLLEATIGRWSDEELFEFKEHRQNIVWTLEKIAVWPPFTLRAIQLLTRLALNENADYANNATGTLVGLFRIGPEAAATESTPQARLPGLLKLLRSSTDAGRRLALKAVSVALDARGTGFRIVGPEYQGLRERANLWVPETYGEWWEAQHTYFQALVAETQSWPANLRGEVCEVLLCAVEQQISVPPCTDLAFDVLDTLTTDAEMAPSKLNRFFAHWLDYHDETQHGDIFRKLRLLQRRYAKRDVVSRFQRYVIDVDWMEWDENFRERHKKPKNRAKDLVNALAGRIASHPGLLSEIQHLLSPTTNAPALWHFGEQLAGRDTGRILVSMLAQVAVETKHQVCLHAYLSVVRTVDPDFYQNTLNAFLSAQETAWLGAVIALRSSYDERLFEQCLKALEIKWIDPSPFGCLRYGKELESVPSIHVEQLLQLLNKQAEQSSQFLLVELLTTLPFSASSPFTSHFVFEIVSKSIPDESGWGGVSGYDWKDVCEKLIEWDPSLGLPLLNALLTEMGKTYRLSYDSYVEPLATELVRRDPSGAWQIIKAHFEQTLPKWRSDLLGWMKGGLTSFSQDDPKGAVAVLPINEILQWVQEDPEPRSVLIAHAAAPTLDDEHGGQLTRELLFRYGQFDGVQGGISASFHSGGWTGPTSVYLKGKQEKLRGWLTAGFEVEVVQWIESELEYLDRSIEREETEEERSRFD